MSNISQVHGARRLPRSWAVGLLVAACVAVAGAAAASTAPTSAAAVATPSVPAQVPQAPDLARAVSVNYYLPWTAGATWPVSQGVDGQVSHDCDTTKHCYAYDFADNAGQPVRAAAPGEIVKVERDVTGQTSRGSWGNFVLLSHADGTCTRYAHMAHGSVTDLGVGRKVFQGQQLGLVGNTGYTLPRGGGHHLHWQREDCSNSRSIQTGFVETGGVVLSEGVAYTSKNNQYEGKIVRRTDGISWVVKNAQRRHIPDFPTDVCAAWERDLPSVALDDAQLGAIPESSEKYKCDLNGSVLHAVDGPEPRPAYRFHGGERHAIPDSQTYAYWTNQPGARIVDAPRAVVEDGRLKLGSAEPKKLYAPDQEGKILRRNDGVSWVVRGGKRFHIPDYATDLCAHYAQGRSVLSSLVQSQVASIPEAADKHSCNLNRKILRASDRPDPKPAFAYHGNQRFSIGDPWTYDYLVRDGFQVLDVPYSEITDSRLANGGAEGPKLNPLSIPPLSIVRRADGVSWVVDANRVRHHIPYVQDDVCWRNLGNRGIGPLPVVATGLTAGQASSVGSEGDRWPCIIGTRVVKSTDGSSHLVDTANARHAIPDTDTYWALVRKHGPAVGPWQASDVNALPEGAPHQQMLDPEAVKNSLVCRNDGVCWAVDGNAVRHHIPSYGDNVCWRWVNGWKVSRNNVNSDQAASLAEGDPWGCSMDGRIIATNEGPAYYMSGNTRRWIPDGYDFECLQRGRTVIRGMSSSEAGRLAEGSAMPAQECSGINIVTIYSPANSRYVTTEINYTGSNYAMVRAARTSVGSDWERFRLIGNCASRCLIQSMNNRKLVMPQLDYQGPAWGEMRGVSSNDNGTWEGFRLEGDCSTGCYIFAHGNGRYVSAELDYTGAGYGMLRARATARGGWERFIIR